MRIYSAPNYAMGATASTESVTLSERSRAEAAIKSMRSSLAGWLKYRSILTAQVAGTIPSKLPKATVAAMIAARAPIEMRLGKELYALLCEMFDSASLPDPTTPEAAVQLAQIAVTGKLPTEGGPSAQGALWMWPVALVVGAVLLTVIVKIRSDADVAKEEMKTACIQSGGCTDTGFWLKAAAIAVLGWFVWDKFGGREVAGRARRRISG